MKPTYFELRQMNRQDESLCRFKERNFDACGYDGAGSFVWVFVFSIPIIGQFLLICAFAVERIFVFIRIVKILLLKIKTITMKTSDKIREPEEDHAYLFIFCALLAASMTLMVMSL